MGGVVDPSFGAISEARQVSPTSSSCQRSHIATSHQKPGRDVDNNKTMGTVCARVPICFSLSHQPGVY